MSRKMWYRNQLKDQRWSRRRMEIMRRDGFRCRRCGATGNLNVHHKWYIYGRKPWQYPDRYLVTLCEKCHHREHLMRHVRFFIWLSLLLLAMYLIKTYR